MSEPRPHQAASREAIAEAEELIAQRRRSSGPSRTSLEGYDYLAGRIRSSLQMAFDYDLDQPVLINPTHQFSRQGLDNPDALYFNAYLARGRRVRRPRASAAPPPTCPSR